MKAIIMAGGFGTRLRPLTINIPKPMVDIADIPMMEHVVTLLKQHHITDITSLLYFQPDAIRDYFKDGSAFGVKMDYIKPTEDYGTAGAVRCALDNINEPVLVISGDLITDFDLTEAIEWHKEKQSQATILLTRIENPLAYGIVITDDNGRIERFLEKPSWGEAFSDTINTGIYILEPEVLKLIPEKTNYDFSQNLYPIMLQKQMGLYGKIMTGYWKDVGNVNEYQLVHDDLFGDNLKLDLKKKEVPHENGVLFEGNNVRLEDNVTITGKVIIGDDALIEKGASLHDCVIGARTRIGSNSEINNSVIWPDNSIGSECSFSNAIVCQQTKIGNNVQLLDKVIISDECVIGSDATVKANCKIWPGKTVDEGAIVSSSMVWGENWNRELFTNAKISGLALTEITPEMAVQVGGAFGAYLGEGAAVVLSRDASDTSRLIKRAFIAGLLASGVNVADIETLPVPLLRFCLTKGNYGAGVYIRHNPQDYRQLDLIFFDGDGLDLPTAKSKKVERMYFGEDYDRASLDNIGYLEIPRQPLEDYRRAFMTHIDDEIIRKAGFKIVIDHSNGSSSQIFPLLLPRLSISATELNGSLNPRYLHAAEEDSARSIVQMSAIVKSLHADVGFIINAAAEKIFVVDENGLPIDNQLFLLILTELYLQTHNSTRIAVPVAASMGVEEIAARYNTEVIRVSNEHLAMMQIAASGEVDFVGGTRGGAIFAGMQLGSDAVFTTVKILEMLAKTKTTFGELRAQFDHLYRKTISIPCPWSKKGTVMRQLIINSNEKQRQLIDGVRIFEDGGWVLVTPDRLTASFNISAEAISDDRLNAIVDTYANIVKVYQNEE